MATEARALLDEQIAALNALRFAADWAYMGAAVLPTLVRQQSAEKVASHLAKLVVDGRTKLDACLDRAEHWLGPTDPVHVPIPLAEGNCPSACAGAAHLLQQLAVLTGIEADSSEPLPTDTGKLAKALTDKFQSGIPDWLLSAPVDDVQQLADVVKQETDAAIARATNEYRTAQFSGIGPALDAVAQQIFNPNISDTIADADAGAYRPGEVLTVTSAKRKRSGRPKADYKTKEREAQLAADWERARDAGTYKADFAKDNKLTVRKLDALLDRVAKRKARSDN